MTERQPCGLSLFLFSATDFGAVSGRCREDYTLEASEQPARACRRRDDFTAAQQYDNG